jgi:hypothetical protein
MLKQALDVGSIAPFRFNPGGFQMFDQVINKVFGFVEPLNAITASKDGFWQHILCSVDKVGAAVLSATMVFPVVVAEVIGTAICFTTVWTVMEAQHFAFLFHMATELLRSSDSYVALVAFIASFECPCCR